MFSMSTKSFCFWVTFLVMTISIESAPSHFQRPKMAGGGSGELPHDVRNSMEKDEFLPPSRFGDPPFGWNNIRPGVDDWGQPGEDEFVHNNLGPAWRPGSGTPDFPVINNGEDQENEEEEETYYGNKALSPKSEEEDDEGHEVPKGDCGEEGGPKLDDEDAEDAEEPESFHGGFIFDAPFFSVRQVSKYFQQLEKALEHVFQQTMDEATLLNGTYANTTEEEVEIEGKTYLVQKSLIKGKDNNSSIYIEALSSMPKINRTEVVKDSGL